MTTLRQQIFRFMTDALRFPIGKFTAPALVGATELRDYRERIRSYPDRLRRRVAHWSDTQLAHPYRPGGWTVRQLVHHLADSHLNSYLRFKLALTEERPTIRPYHEDRWAQLPDSQLPIGVSLDLLTALHHRWGTLLDTFGAEDLIRVFVHPADGKAYRLDEAMGLYAWHGDHHLAHIEGLAQRQAWT